MYRELYQGGLLTILAPGGQNPLNHWRTVQRDGQVSRFLDSDLKSMVLEIRGFNVSTAYIECPDTPNQVLGIRMPFFVMVVKNINDYFSFEITIMDDSHFKRRYRASNFQSCTQITNSSTSIPLHLSAGWNQIHFNLVDFTRRVYNKQYLETISVKINANIRIRRIYFSTRIYSDTELPPEYKLFYPLGKKQRKEPEKPTGAEAAKASSAPSQAPSQAAPAPSATAEEKPAEAATPVAEEAAPPVEQPKAEAPAKAAEPEKVEAPAEKAPAEDKPAETEAPAEAAAEAKPAAEGEKPPPPEGEAAAEKPVEAPADAPAAAEAPPAN